MPERKIMARSRNDAFEADQENVEAESDLNNSRKHGHTTFPQREILCGAPREVQYVVLY
jgi:hypothetical protein